MRIAVLAVSLLLVFAARAGAAPFVVGSGDLPDVAVEANGTAHIAWNGTETGDPAHYCRLPRGAVACDVALTLPLPAGALGSTTRPIVVATATGISVLHYTYGQTAQVTQYTSTDGGVTFPAVRTAGSLAPYASAVGPGDSVSIVTHADGRGTLFQNMPLTGGPTTAFANFGATRPYYGAVGLDGSTPVVIAETGASFGAVHRFTGTDLNSEGSWSSAVEIGYLDYPHLAGGPLGLWVMAEDEADTLFVRRYDGTTFGPRVAVSSGDASETALFQDPGGRMHAVFPRLDASGYHGTHAVSDDGVTWRSGEIDVQPADQQGAMRVAAAADHVGVAVWRAAGPQIKVAAIGPDAPGPPPVVQPPPPPDPLPQFGKTVVVRPVSGVVRVRLPGSSQFVALSSIDDVPLRSTIDTKRGRVELRSVPKAGGEVQSVQLYDGMFAVTQTRGITNFTLNEPLARCPRRGSAAAKKPKTRKLWGDGRGAFRTSGKYSAATVRGTRWLVQDSCAGTLTRVTQGSVTVTTKLRGPVRIVRAGKKVLVRAKR